MKKFQLPKVETANLSHSLASTDDEATEITSGDENRQRNILVLDYWCLSKYNNTLILLTH